jgi:hypothetical protein
VAEWLGAGLQNLLPRFNSGRRLDQERALSSGVERFLDAEEARGSNPLGPTQADSIIRSGPLVALQPL